MSAAPEDEIALPSSPTSADPKVAATVKNGTVEVREDGLETDAPKAYYSKLSVWLMIVYSGLAIGSDG